jgi:hypothetical protein
VRRRREGDGTGGSGRRTILKQAKAPNDSKKGFQFFVKRKQILKRRFSGDKSHTPTLGTVEERSASCEFFGRLRAEVWSSSCSLPPPPPPPPRTSSYTYPHFFVVTLMVFLTHYSDLVCCGAHA